MERRKTMFSLIPWKKSDRGGTLTTDPFERDFNRIRNEFDSLLTRMWSGLPAFGDDFFENRAGWSVDVDETDTHYTMRIPAPGFEVENFDVQISGNQLIVRAERKDAQDNKNGGSAYRYGHLQRMIALPDSVETDKIDASYHSGILELKIPKGKESQAKRIEVRAG
jgi:HSP20 family protein